MYFIVASHCFWGKVPFSIQSHTTKIIIKLVLEFWEWSSFRCLWKISNLIFREQVRVRVGGQIVILKRVKHHSKGLSSFSNSILYWKAVYNQIMLKILRKDRGKNRSVSFVSQDVLKWYIYYICLFVSCW